MSSVVITAAPTGPIATKADNPNLPTTPEEIAAAATAAYDAGAAVVHVHLRDADERPTADLGIARTAMDLIRERSPILIQLSTGVGLDVPFAEREKLVELRPRMATLNPCSMTFANGEFRNPPQDVRRLAARMQELGVKAELEVYDMGHIPVCLSLFEEGLLVEPLQFSIVMGVKGGMAATIDNLTHAVRMLPPDTIWQVIAIGRANLDLTAVAVAMGGNARTGMEDTLYLRKGELAPSNQELVSRLANVCTALDRPIASVGETEELLRLGPDPALA
ncbi:MAG TPA: 3-keto-5-aminohexanoate cleavage protein [Acidimicrobiales bacterium]|nr:3-keto-5-aminohexanoate cleavage protein [Acidimicrobiales bacterium]